MQRARARRQAASADARRRGAWAPRLYARRDRALAGRRQLLALSLRQSSGRAMTGSAAPAFENQNGPAIEDPRAAEDDALLAGRRRRRAPAAAAAGPTAPAFRRWRAGAQAAAPAGKAARPEYSRRRGRRAPAAGSRRGATPSRCHAASPDCPRRSAWRSRAPRATETASMSVARTGRRSVFASAMASTPEPVPRSSGLSEPPARASGRSSTRGSRPSWHDGRCRRRRPRRSRWRWRRGRRDAAAVMAAMHDEATCLHRRQRGEAGFHPVRLRQTLDVERRREPIGTEPVAQRRCQSSSFSSSK